MDRTKAEAGREPGPGVFAELRRREPVFAAAAAAFALAALPTLAAALLDERTLGGVNVWIKPLKFYLSISIWFAGFAWASAWLPAGVTARRWWRPWALLLVAAAVAEMAWITGAAAFGVASHYNAGSAAMRAAYSAAAVFATFLITPAPVYATLIWRGGGAGLAPDLRLSLILGGLLTLPLMLLAGFTLGGAGSHFVGPGVGSAAGLPLLGWARDGGDLRVAHFFALHMVHILPLAGFAAAYALPGRAGRLAVIAAAAALVCLTLFTLRQALAGEPFLPFL